jgi:hypothetical protein
MLKTLTERFISQVITVVWTLLVHSWTERVEYYVRILSNVVSALIQDP